MIESSENAFGPCGISTVAPDPSEQSVCGLLEKPNAQISETSNIPAVLVGSSSDAVLALLFVRHTKILSKRKLSSAASPSIPVASRI